MYIVRVALSSKYYDDHKDCGKQTYRFKRDPFTGDVKSKSIDIIVNVFCDKGKYSYICNSCGWVMDESEFNEDDVIPIATYGKKDNVAS